MKALRKIGRQISQLRRELKTAVKEVNGQAARKLAQGNYEASQGMVALAKAVQQFAIETKEFNERWNAIRKQQSGKPKAKITPVWEYYRLIARAISNVGGETTFEEIVEWITKMRWMSSNLKIFCQEKREYLFGRTPCQKPGVR